MKTHSHARFRSHPFLAAALTGVLIAIGSAAQAQVNAGGPAGSPSALVRAAALAALSDDVPDQVEPAAAQEPAPLPTNGFFAEPRFIRRGISFATRTVGDASGTRSGFYPEFSNMPSGSGWISAGPGYRQYLLNDRIVVDASTSVSWRFYKMAQGRVEFPKLARSRIAAGSQFMWQDLTQVTYYGNGAASLEEDRSEYRMRYGDFVGYVNLKPVRWLTIGGRAGYLDRPVLSDPAGAFKRGNPATSTVFAGDPVYQLSEQPNYLHGDVTVTADTRDSRSHPSSGGVYRAVVTAYSDRNAGAFSFRRYEAEAAHFVPLAERRVVLAARAWVIGSETSEGQTVPFYLMPSLGGNTTLRSFNDYRFHDRNVLLVNVESRFAVFTHLDFAAFADAGNVAARFGDLDFGKRGYGVGLRLHTGSATFARFDVAHGTEGWQFMFRTTDPLHLSRLSRRTAAVPFVP